MFNIIAAIGKNGELGKDGELVFHLAKDMRFFKATTTGHKVLMGRKTWESLPSKLSNRFNMVVSRSELQGEMPDLVIGDLDKFISANEDTPDEIFVIGGGMLYEKMLPYCDRIYLTEIDSSAEADTFFPRFDKSLYEAEVVESGIEQGLGYTITVYKKGENG